MKAHIYRSITLSCGSEDEIGTPQIELAVEPGEEMKIVIGITLDGEPAFCAPRNFDEANGLLFELEEVLGEARRIMDEWAVAQAGETPMGSVLPIKRKIIHPSPPEADG